ncbi:MAG: MATE family efflux transporter [Aerococcus sp.]|nr:MATE family efflux transporter [Aerococcus sp.]
MTKEHTLTNVNHTDSSPDVVKKPEPSMTHGNIGKILLLFSIPLILGNLLQQMYNAVDSIIVGNYVGSQALAAVGSSTAIIYLLIAFSQGIAVGAGVLVSQAVGAHRTDATENTVHTSLVIAVLLGLFLSVVGFLFTPQILMLMKTPSDVMGESVTYLRFFSLGLIFNVIYNMEAGILNAVGNSKRSLLYLGIASVTNIFLDLFFIRTLNFGVMGAAIATDISQALSCVLALHFLMHTNEHYQVHLERLRLNKDTAVQIIKVGLPTGIQNMVISLSNVLVQSSINVFGSTTMAGYGAYMKIDGFNILPILSLSLASTTFTGQNFGAGKIDRIKRGMRTTLLMVLIYTAFIGATLLFFSQAVMGLFTTDKQVIAAGIQAMRHFCPFYFLLGILQALCGTIRGTGKTVPPMIILLISMCLFRILWIQLIFPHFNTIDSIYSLYPVSWAFGVILCLVYMWRSDWLKLPV